MTAPLDPITKDQRKEARSMVRYATKRHYEHALAGEWEETWCLVCRRAYLARQIARLDALLLG